MSVTDLREAQAPPRVVDTVKREFGGLDILVNNAGTTKRGDFFALTDEDWADGYSLEVLRPCPAGARRLAAVEGTQGCAGRDRRHQRPQAREGGSPSAVRSTPRCAAFTKCLADLGKEDGVQVNCIHPSLVETERQWRRIRAAVEQTGEPEDKVRAALCRETGITRFGTVEDVADLVTFMVSSRATWLQGATIDLDGGEIPVL